MNSCNQIFLPLNFFSPEVLGKALRFMLLPRSKPNGEKNPFYNLKLLRKSSREIRWKIIQNIIHISNFSPWHSSLIVCLCMCVHAHTQSCLTFWGPVDCSRLGSSAVEFSRQEYWRGMPLSPPGDLPSSGIYLASLAFAFRFYTTSATWVSWIVIKDIPTFLSTLCLPTPKHFSSSYLLMVSSEVQHGTGAFDLHFSAQRKPNAAVLGRTVHRSELTVADSLKFGFSK